MNFKGSSFCRYRNYIFGNLGIVFIWSCFASWFLFLLFYVSLRNLCSGTHRMNPFKPHLSTFSVYASKIAVKLLRYIESLQTYTYTLIKLSKYLRCMKSKSTVIKNTTFLKNYVNRILPNDYFNYS